jgi:predicted transcriptional regulator
MAPEPLKRTTIYIAPSLQEHLRDLARQHKRSFTGEVLWALEQYVQATSKQQNSRGSQERGTDAIG